MDRDLTSAERSRLRLRRSLPWVLGIAVLFVVVSGAIALLEPSIDPADLTIATVERGAIRETLEASGRVVPAFELVLSSPVEARVQRVLRTTGETLEEGAVLVELDASESRLGHERIEERIAQKRNSRQQLEAEIAQSQLASRSRIEQKQLDVEILGYQAEQKRTLANEGLIAEEEARRTEVEAKKAAIELGQLRLAAESSARTDQAKLAGIDLELAILTKERDQSSRQLELAEMRAPRRGVLTWIVPQEGATVARGEVLARIADVSRFRIEGTISDIHASRIATGMETIVVSGNRRANGVIASVDPTVRNGAVNFQVEVPEDAGLELRNNLRVDLHIVLASRENALRLPRGPGIGEARRQEVFVVRDGRAVLTPVETGLTGHDAVEIVSGVREGDRVIVSDMTSHRGSQEIRLEGEKE